MAVRPPSRVLLFTRGQARQDQNTQDTLPFLTADWELLSDI